MLKVDTNIGRMSKSEKRGKNKKLNDGQHRNHSDMKITLFRDRKKQIECER